MIEVKNLYKSFDGNKMILNGINEKIEKGEKVVVIEDLISTGGSVIEVVEALREAGAEVLGIVSIFSYNMSKSAEKLSGANVENVSLSNLDELCEVAQEKKIIGPEEVRRVLAFRDNPSDESWIKN